MQVLRFATLIRKEKKRKDVYRIFHGKVQGFLAKAVNCTIKADKADKAAENLRVIYEVMCKRVGVSLWKYYAL